MSQQLESLVLDGTELNTGASTYNLEAVTFPPPRKRPEWVTGPDTDGAALVRDPLFDNRTVTAKIRIGPSATRDTSLNLIGTLVDKLEEAERNPAGIDLVWTPSGSDRSFTFKVLSGEIDDVPITHEDIWFAPLGAIIPVTFTCKPFAYGAEELAGSTTGALPLIEVTLSGVKGDVPAEGRLVFTDAASQVRRYAEWGIEQRYYQAATPLLIDSASLTVTGYAGTAGTARTGAYGGTVVRIPAGEGPVTGCSTGNQSHIGTFRVKARVWTSSTTFRARLRWQDGDGPFRVNDWTVPPVFSQFAEIDLGMITLSPAVTGTQRWKGEIVVESVGNTGTDNFDVDYLILMPVGEGYGRARSVLHDTAALSEVARDNFTSTTAGATLDGRVAPTGGTWAANTSFVLADEPTASDETVKRTASSDTNPVFGVIGATTYTDMKVSANISATVTSPSVEQGVVARYGSSTDYLAFVVRSGGFFVRQVVGGVTTTLISSAGAVLYDRAGYRITLVVYATGQFVATLADSNGAKLVERTGSSTELSATGSLNNGKPGIIDQNTGATVSSRYYDLFIASVPSPESVVIYSGRKLEVRHDTVIRESTGGGVWGPVPGYRGSRFLVEPAGIRARTARVAAKAHRNNIEDAAAEQVSDSLTVQAYITPRYIAVPRS